ncbi:hypothetical protein ABIE51_003739 [Lysobacter sp. OAE881]|uniref:hypothetical protein n=1 Tax=Lysobacter sp. OAE881 TaxID=2663813 RepID=UPI00178B9307
MSISEVVRRRTITHLLEVEGVQACWPVWQQAYRTIAGTPPTATSLITGLGENLGNVFRTTGGQGRSQSGLSGGGAAWEALICWYMNLCLIGTRAVVVKKKSHLPAPVRDALTLSYGASQTNTESDLIALTFPADSYFDAYDGTYTGAQKVELDAVLGTRMAEVEACIVQCKTNWNDNAQIPMLWDLVYASRGFGIPNVSIGRSPHSIQTLKRFAYAFVTLPSNATSRYAITSMPVLRVRNLSGGNYWGFGRKNGVAGALTDIFAKNFVTSTQSLGRPWQNFLDDQLLRLDSEYSYFNY